MDNDGKSTLCDYTVTAQVDMNLMLYVKGSWNYSRQRR